MVLFPFCFAADTNEPSETLWSDDDASKDDRRRGSSESDSRGEEPASYNKARKGQTSKARTKSSLSDGDDDDVTSHTGESED